MARLPSLNALRTFEAVARLGSMAEAATELHVTQSAVSRQIRALEEELRLPLFRRVHRGLVLTAKGQALAATLREALGLVAQGVERLTRSSERLRVRVLPTFGIRWLMPRLSRFEARHPEWQIEVNLVWDNFEPQDQDYDAGIVSGRGPWPDACLTPILTERLTPVCSPGFLRRQALPEKPNAFDIPQLLHCNPSKCGFPDWRLWAEEWGAPSLATDRGEAFDTLDLALRAAETGRGVAMADLAMIEDDLALGRLVLPYPEAVVTGETYYFVEPDPDHSPPITRAFCDWLKAEALASSAPERLREPFGV